MSSFGLGLKYFFVDLLGGILRWPFWWYSKGLVLALANARGTIENYAKSIALGVWIKNIFVPMYGTRDWQSRLISIFMRTVQIVGRSIALCVWVFVVSLLFFIYLTLPVLTFGMLLFHLTAFIS